jgi:drug/metabolite transporter (DMT)-like permease
LIWLRERFTLFEWAGVLTAIAGTFVITFQPGDFLWLGVLMVVVSTFMYALHAALVKRHGGGISLTDFFLFRLACTTAFLFLFSLGRGELTVPDGPTWLILLLAGMGCNN